MSKRRNSYLPTKVGLTGNESGVSSKERLYGIWNQMLARCYNPEHNRYHRYGGRGIQVCPEWHTYLTFRSWATSEGGYVDGAQIDRIHTDGDYEPGNVRWTSARIQQQNRSNNKRVSWRGETKSLAEWAEDPRCRVPYKVLWERLSRGWEFERALTSPQRSSKAYRQITALGETKGLQEWVDDPRCAVESVQTLWKRLNDGWPEEKAVLAPVRRPGPKRR